MKKVIALYALAISCSTSSLPRIIEASGTISQKSYIITKEIMPKPFVRILCGTLLISQIQEGEEERLEVSADINVMPYVTQVFAKDCLLLGRSEPLTIMDDVALIYHLKIKSLHDVTIADEGVVVFTTPFIGKLLTLEMGSSKGSITIQHELNVNTLNIEISGKGDISCMQPIQVGLLNAEIAGDGTITLNGTATQQIIKISGTGLVDTKNLVGEEGSVSIKGGASAYVNITEYLSVNAPSQNQVLNFGSALAAFKKTEAIKRDAAHEGHPYFPYYL
jgi:hypothetical protein